MAFRKSPSQRPLTSLSISIDGANVVQQRNATVGAPVSKTFSSGSVNVPTGLFVGDNAASLYVVNTFGDNTVWKFDRSTASVRNRYNLIAPTAT